MEHWSATNPTWTGLELNKFLRGERPATKFRHAGNQAERPHRLPKLEGIGDKSETRDFPLQILLWN
jgi:hypothetical protein